jgi:DNA-binding NarL/FixJ family response regulator
MPESDNVTVVVGAFEPILSAGLKALLNGGSSVRVLVSDVDDATLEDVVARRRPQVVIVGETVESDLLARIKTSRSVAGVLVLAQAPSAQCGTLLLANGVSCVARSASVVDLFAAVRSAAAGEPMLVDSGAGRVMRRRRGEALTPRELAVFALLRVGGTYAEIAEELHIAPTTVRSHTGKICRKLGVRSKRELIGFALPIGMPDG